MRWRRSLRCCRLSGRTPGRLLRHYPRGLSRGCLRRLQLLLFRRRLLSPRFGEPAAPGIFRRLRPTRERVCVIAADGRARASLATGTLRSAGCVNAVPVDSGMKDWVAPVRQKRIAANVRAYRARVALSVMAAAAAAALHDLRLAALFLAIAGVLLLKVKFSQRIRMRQGAGLGTNHVMKDFGRPN